MIAHEPIEEINMSHAKPNTSAPRKAAISPRHHADGPSWTRCRPDCVSPTPFQAHCPATGCHRTFGGVSGFDKHRKDGHCVDPTTLGMVLNRGIWRMPLDEAGRARLEELR